MIYLYLVAMIAFKLDLSIKIANKNGSTDSDVLLSALPTGAGIHDETTPSGDE